MNEEPQGKDENSAEKNLTRHFKQLEAKNVSPPDELKDEVFNSLDTLNLVGDFLDLFTAKFAASNISILDAMTTKQDDTPTDEN